MSLRALPAALCAAGLLAGAPVPGLAGVDVSLTCVPSFSSPKVPNRRVGDPMAVALELSNTHCENSAEYGGLAVGLVGNAGGTLAGVAIFGPWKRHNTGSIDPATCTPMGFCAAPVENQSEACSVDADCDFAGGDGVCEIQYFQLETPTTITELVHVTGAMPAPLAGTVAAAVVSVDVDDGYGVEQVDATCKVNVVP